MTAGPNVFIDSNVWLYALSDKDDEKAKVARELIDKCGTGVCFTTQVVNEVCVNLKRRSAFTEQQVQTLVSSFFLNYKFVGSDEQVLIGASELRTRHAFSFWDSLIATSALLADVDILYSEDMQDGFVIENRLKIVNPFKI